MFSELAIGQHLLHNPMCHKNCSDKKFTILSFGCLSFNLYALEVIYNQFIQAKFMPPKRVCLQLENHALITRFD